MFNMLKQWSGVRSREPGDPRLSFEVQNLNTQTVHGFYVTPKPPASDH
jgi:hypothetical protein